MSASPRSTPDHHEDHLHEGRGERIGLARIPAQGGETIRCRHCSAPAPEQLVRIAGAWSVVEGTAVWDCDSCARARLHEFEAEGQAHHRVPSHA
jgi:hypothetical protein